MPNDAITSLLLFQLGLPALVYQILPEEIRGLVIPNRSFFVKFILPLLLSIFAVVITYFFCARHGASCPSWSWDVTLTILLVFSLWTSAMIFLTINKKRLIHNLELELVKNYHNRDEYIEEALYKLELIGKESKGGEDRKLAINALDRLANNVLDSEFYTGGQLEGLMLTLDHILLESGEVSTPDNYRTAITILDKIITRSYKGLSSNRAFYDADLGHAWRYLGVWARKSLDLPEQSITAECLDPLNIRGTKSNPALSEALREIGIAAVNHNPPQMQIALEAARKIQAILSRDEKQPYPEVLYDLIALLAYIWSHGQSGAAWIRQEFDIANRQILYWAECAIEHQRGTGHFEIADRVKAMYDAWR